MRSLKNEPETWALVCSSLRRELLTRIWQKEAKQLWLCNLICSRFTFLAGTQFLFWRSTSQHQNIQLPKGDHVGGGTSDFPWRSLVRISRQFSSPFFKDVIFWPLLFLYMQIFQFSVHVFIFEIVRKQVENAIFSSRTGSWIFVRLSNVYLDLFDAIKILTLILVFFISFE